MEDTKLLVEAALKAGVKFIVKAHLAGPASESDSTEMAKLHFESEQILKDSGIPYCIVHSSLLFNTILTFQRSNIKHKSVLQFPRTSHMWVSPTDVGHAIAKILIDPKPHIGKTYYFQGKESLSAEDITQQLAAKLGMDLIVSNFY